MPIIKKKFHDFDFATTFYADTLKIFDEQFLNYLQQENVNLHAQLLAYRQQTLNLPESQTSEVLIQLAQVFEEYLVEFFDIETANTALRMHALSHDPIFAFKKEFIQRRAKRRLTKLNEALDFVSLNSAVENLLIRYQLTAIDKELAVAQLGLLLLADADKTAADIALLTDWCAHILMATAGTEFTKNWVLFKLPNKLDYYQLVPVETINTPQYTKQQGLEEHARLRDGFNLTDKRMNLREVQNEVNYCIYCHDHDGDFCSKGFPVKKGDPEQGLKQNPLGKTLTGCPLDEKISEMHRLRRDGFTLGALAMVMIDNPMCPVTGHRICNDCMKACIYQKQDPVNIPQIETNVLISVLDLPWGVEIYDLLTRWNPLRQQQWQAKAYNGLKLFIAGMGPAGFTLAHHMLMEGFAVVGSEGLKIEPLPQQFLTHPIKDYNSLKENLDTRIMAGFGGVAEYGITVRWDKNFLKLIYLSLSRRPYFQVFGGVRFGGTMTIEDAWDLGFNHLTIAVGAGLPQALPIPGSLAPGMRQANDFLMALQLTGAAKNSSLTNLQIRLPAIVIGGGLTGIDAATEVQAYYIVQVEKILTRYEKLTKAFGAARIREHLDEESLGVLSEFLAHGQQVREERQQAELEKRPANFRHLIRQWGGVTVAYRRRLQESPAYCSNHEEVAKAFEEGIFYAEQLEPNKAYLDQFGHIKSLCFHRRQQNAEGIWETIDDEVELPARCVLVATGARPNIAYEFEHRGSLERRGFQYIAHEWHEGELHPVSTDVHCKAPQFGPFTSYQQDNKLVSFVGDTHSVFHGNVVNAVASGKRTYPKILQALAAQLTQIGDDKEYKQFATQMNYLFRAEVMSVTRHTPTALELKIRAPMAAKKFAPGQFFRIQNYESTALMVENTRLQTEAMAMTGADVDPISGEISVMVLEKGVSSRLCATFKPGDHIALMGPTGVRTSIPTGNETVLIMGGRYCAAHIRAVGPAMRAAGNKVIYIASFHTAEDIYCQADLEAAADVIIWAIASGKLITPRRPQDKAVQGDFTQALLQYAKGELHAGQAPLPLQTVDRVLVIGSSKLLRLFQQLRQHVLKEYLLKSPQVIGSVSSCMQCMMKGVCAQCLQWQIDPATGERTKAVFACSWQDQPLDLVELDNLEERLSQNKLQEHLSNLWLDYLFAHYDIARV